MLPGGVVAGNGRRRRPLPRGMRSFFLVFFTSLVIAADAPPTAAATVTLADGRLTITYAGAPILSARIASAATLNQATTPGERGLTQTITLAGDGVTLEGEITAGVRGLAAELGQTVQQRFRICRNTDGSSDNARNDAVYGGEQDWVLHIDGARLVPQRAQRDEQPQRFTVRATASAGAAAKGKPATTAIRIRFLPRYFSQHRGLKYFEPWNTKACREPAAGWCSWFARIETQDGVDGIIQSFQDARLPAFGLRYIQIDDGPQRGTWPKAQGGAKRVHGDPRIWLEWNERQWPGGIPWLVERTKQAGMEAGVWISCAVSPGPWSAEHPEFFLQQDGKPRSGSPMVNLALDARVSGAAERIIAPIFRGLRERGVTYVKVDHLRHLIYDAYNAAGPEAGGPEALNAYIRAVRAAWGDDNYLLICWGVLPEGAGIADACRLGGDGYKPGTVSMYNSLNGIVWRSDPDHVNIASHVNAKPSLHVGSPGDVRWRPALCAIAGASLMLTDRAATYRQPEVIEGLRRSLPLPASLPGQLYDVNNDRSRHIDPATRSRAGRAGGAGLDASGDAPYPWWLHEVARPFGRWWVLARFNAMHTTVDSAPLPKPAPATTVALADLGLDHATQWLAWDFWNWRFLGRVTKEVALAELPGNDCQMVALHPQLDRPQLIATSRHLSMGGPDLTDVRWDAATQTLSGVSRHPGGELYKHAVHLPDGWKAAEAEADGLEVELVREGPIAELRLTPPQDASTPVLWRLRCTR